MTYDIGITVFKNLKCLRVMAKGLKRACGDLSQLGRVLLHVQEPGEQADALDCFSSIGLSAEIVSNETAAMDVVLNRLTLASKADWILLTEQDVFIYCDLPATIRYFDDYAYNAAGPVDTFHYSNPNARGHKLYGQHGRLSPEPGYFHSSFVFLKKSAIAQLPAPFTIPDGFKMHGYGVLGGEPYYGLRINLGEDRGRLAFFTQTHCGTGYAADIGFGDRLLATHLYFSATKHGYHDAGFLDDADYVWLKSEEDRFLAAYLNQL